MPPKPVAWGYVKRTFCDKKGRNKDFLVAIRDKPDDPLRQYQLVLPGGGIEYTEHGYYETYGKAAMREVLEETGIAAIIVEELKGYEFNVENPFIRARVEKNGNIYITYLDSGKEYKIRLVQLFPTPIEQTPKATDSDAKNPRYESLDKIMDSEFVSRFTPACQVGLEIIRRFEGFTVSQ